jgi:hypothetical protein
MILPIYLGTDLKSGKKIFIPPRVWATHLHCIGATGAGKTSAMALALFQLMLDGSAARSFFIIDPVGTLSNLILRFVANKKLCTQAVRDRFVYFEPAYENYATVINPLHFEGRVNQDYQIARGMEITLRGFESDDIEKMPRLRTWSYKSLFTLSEQRLPLSMSKYLLTPGTDEHTAILARLPRHLQLEWREILTARGGEAVRILESTRNRMGLFSDNVLLARLFSDISNLFDVPRFVRGGKIVLVNLTPGPKKVPFHVADTIGSLLINEIFNHGLTLFYEEQQPIDTFVVLDEFQRFLGRDIYDFLPIVRNMGIHMILGHQSFSQLEKGEIDLTPMIGQARSRLIFANDFEDADRIAMELASITWNPMQIKHRLETLRQILTGHRIDILNAGGTTTTDTGSWTHQQSRARGESRKDTYGKPIDIITRNEQTGTSDVKGGSKSQADQSSWHETLVPVYDNYYETSRIDFWSKDEETHQWGQVVRDLKKGQTITKFVEDSELRHVQVGYLPLDNSSEVREAVAELKEQNYQQDCFLTATEADRRLEELRRQLLQGPVLSAGTSPVTPCDGATPNTDSAKAAEDPFRS